jgi:hypothetical protein
MASQISVNKQQFCNQSSGGLTITAAEIRRLPAKRSAEMLGQAVAIQRLNEFDGDADIGI